MVQAEECWYKSLTPLMAAGAREDRRPPVYLTYDIDSLDPAFAPGTGTVEVGGLTTWQALEIIRGCRGLNLVGGDLVEVSPPLDPVGQHGTDRRRTSCSRCSACCRASVRLKLRLHARGGAPPGDGLEAGHRRRLWWRERQ